MNGSNGGFLEIDVREMWMKWRITARNSRVMSPMIHTVITTLNGKNISRVDASFAYDPWQRFSKSQSMDMYGYTPNGMDRVKNVTTAEWAATREVRGRHNETNGSSNFAVIKVQNHIMWVLHAICRHSRIWSVRIVGGRIKPYEKYRLLISMTSSFICDTCIDGLEFQLLIGFNWQYFDQ